MGLEVIGLLPVFIYVGAICILFLFVIMFLEVRYLESKIESGVSLVGSMLVCPISVGLVYSMSLDMRVELSDGLLGLSSVGVLSIQESLGSVLYSGYSLGFVLCGLILLVAMVAAISISSFL